MNYFVEIILLSRKKQLFIFILDRNVKLFIDYIELLNLMKNKNTNYIISWEKRGNPIKSIPVLLSKFATSNINKANNYSRGVVISSYISLIYTLSVKSHYNYVPRFYN